MGETLNLTSCWSQLKPLVVFWGVISNSPKTRCHGTVKPRLMYVFQGIPANIDLLRFG